MCAVSTCDAAISEGMIRHDYHEIISSIGRAASLSSWISDASHSNARTVARLSGKSLLASMRLLAMQMILVPGNTKLRYKCRAISEGSSWLRQSRRPAKRRWW